MMQSRRGRFGFYTGTWTGRLILVNTVVFIWMCLETGQFFMPTPEKLYPLGVKDPVALAQGEWWRLVTPMFLHIGVLHFAINNFILKVIGAQLEATIGGRWFLFIYFTSGIVGNVASAVLVMNMSAGASGAIFGLFGCGLYIEYAIGRKLFERTGQRLPSRGYLWTVVLNLGFGFLVPFVDNAAHVGGLIAGTALTFSMVKLRPNRLQRLEPAIGRVVIGVLFMALGLGAYLGTSREYLSRTILEEATIADTPGKRFQHLSQYIELEPDRHDLRLIVIGMLFAGGEPRLALFELQKVIDAGGYEEQIRGLAQNMANSGRTEAAWQIRQMLGDAPLPEIPDEVINDSPEQDGDARP